MELYKGEGQMKGIEKSTSVRFVHLCFLWLGAYVFMNETAKGRERERKGGQMLA